MTPMNIFTIWNIPMNILTLLIHKNKTCKTMRLNKTNYMKRQMMTWPLKKNLNIFTTTFITIFHPQQWTLASCLFITMIHKISLMIQRIFDDTAAYYQVDTREKHSTQLSSKVALKNWMEYQTPMCSPTSKCSLTLDLYNLMHKFSMAAKPLQNVLDLSS